MSEILKLKNDRFRAHRGGTSFLLNIVCAGCKNIVLVYQKDGRGGLHRLYLNRILYPPSLEQLQHDQTVRGSQDMSNLTCTSCNAVIGLPMEHSDGRLAFRLRPGFFIKRQRSV